ncbi:hypothetical protein [Demequina sp.]|uniref:hypothetical protein n=1 Tax=Demequina sp. TaxID=2050685 RepID=UPI003D14D65D
MDFRIALPTVNEADGGYTVEAELTFGDMSPYLWFRVPQAYQTSPDTIGDAFLASMLPVAMARGENIVIDAPVSAKLLEALPQIQSIYADWYPDVLTRVEITAAEAVSAAPQGNRTVSCFTGGVDSFYSLVKHKDALDAVLYVDGFDVPLANLVMSRTVKSTISAVASDYGKEATFLSTNLKWFTDKEVNWGLIAHGPALASIGMILQGHVGTMYIPSTHSLKQMFPWGSHVLVDHLWSTERLTFIHDGADASRVTKTQTISHEGPAQRHLRVCWQNKGQYNCGRCEKCLRTMTALELLGVLEDFTVFPETDLPTAVGNLRIANRNGLEFQLENLEYAQEIGSESPVVPGLIRSIDDFVARKGLGGEVKPPFAGSLAAKQARVRAELVALRKETAKLRKDAARLTAENARLTARLAEAEKTLPQRARRRLGRIKRRFVR